MDDLPAALRQHLSTLAPRAAGVSLQHLVSMVQRHLAEINAAKPDHPYLNLALGRSLAAACQQALARPLDWGSNAGRHLKTGILYFIHSNDDEHDLESLIGFEDDAQVINSCLRAAGLSDLCVRVEDFDA